MSQRCVLVVAALLVLSQTARMQKGRTLDIYSIDVEGGQATLFVSPSGESLLVDSGNPGDRDADRIAASAKDAGVSRIDYLVITHYDGDHVGGVKDVASRLPIRTFRCSPLESPSICPIFSKPFSSSTLSRSVLCPLSYEPLGSAKMCC